VPNWIRRQLANPAPALMLSGHQTRSSAFAGRGLMRDQRPDLKPSIRLMIARFVAHARGPVEGQRQRYAGWIRDVALRQNRELRPIW